MMYGVIADALKDVGNQERHPKDYLNFYCLGNRETETEYEKKNQPTKSLDPNSKHVSDSSCPLSQTLNPKSLGLLPSMLTIEGSFSFGHDCIIARPLRSY